MKPNGFFFLPFFIPISTHCRHSRCASVHLSVCVCVRGGAGCHCFPQHKQRKRRTPHSLWWAMCSCVGFNVTRHEAAVKSQLMSAVPFTQWWSEEISVGSTFTSPLRAHMHVYTLSEHMFLPPRLYCDCMSQLIPACIKSQTLRSQ